MNGFLAFLLFTIHIITNLSLSNAFDSSNYVSNSSVMVHLFEWKWNDIADECERFLAPNGYAGVQTSPVNENAVIENRPWYERYQPISYKIATRSGDEDEFKSMVDRCNKVGVRIFVDAVVNHMSSSGGTGSGTGGTTFNYDEMEFPGVPYGPENFHSPPCDISNYNNATEVRVCRLEGLLDLNQTQEDTRGKISQFLNHLLELGVAGIRVDGAKHMYPSDLEVIFNRLNNLSSDAFPANSRPFIFQEVISGDEPVKKTDYNNLGAVTEFQFSREIGKAFRGNNQLKSLKSWPEVGMLPSEDALVFVDNHDNQRSNDGVILTHKDGQRYIMAVAFMLAYPYGLPRVMSSFSFSSSNQGPPADENGATISPSINSTTQQCENGWVCEHRWLEIRNMLKFRLVVGSEPVQSWWDNDSNQIAFCRGSRGFIAFNNDQDDLNTKLNTCLPSGVYCDAITGEIVDGQCSGTQVVVDENGEADINLSPDVGVLAIHVEVKV